jgi:hypothetical protein
MSGYASAFETSLEQCRRPSCGRFRSSSYDAEDEASNDGVAVVCGEYVCLLGVGLYRFAHSDGRKMKKTTTLALLTALSLIAFAGIAEASIKLPIAYSQQQSMRLAQKLCESEPGCESSEVTKCVRKTRNRVDCVVLGLYNQTPSSCAYVIVNELHGTRFEERTRHRVCH